MAASKSPRARLLHIRDEIEGVAMIVCGLSFAQYQGSYMHRRAVERAVQIVSEAAKALPPDFLAKYPNAPWSAIIGIGNILSPKCGGLDVEFNHAKNLSFIAIQEDATPACVSIGLGQSFGMIGVRNYYTANGEKVPEAVLEEAMRGLYSPEIRIGMKRAEAMEHLNEACKFR